MPGTSVGCKFIIEQGVEANATSLVARAWPRTHWKAEKGRGMNKCKLGGGVGCMEGTNSGFDTKLVRPTTHVDQLFYTTMHYLRILKNARFEPKTRKLPKVSKNRNDLSEVFFCTKNEQKYFCIYALAL